MKDPLNKMQVECNAPLKRVAILHAADAAAAAGESLTGNAAIAAADLEMETAHKMEAARVQKAAFRQVTLMRLKEKARERRDAAAAAESATASTKSQFIADKLIQRAKPPAVSMPAPRGSAPPPPLVPTQLALMRAGLSEQALGARQLMLSACEVAPVKPPPTTKPPSAAFPPASAVAPPPAAKKFAPLTDSSCILRATTSTAARADRAKAHEYRMSKKEEARQDIERAHLAEAFYAEREAAERAESLRVEVAALEEYSQAKEEEAAVATVLKAEQERYQKVAEWERYFDGLRMVLRDEAKASGRPLPPICASGIDPLENHTEQCPRNSIFFNNPAAYGRMLSCLFVRPIVID